MYSEKTEKLTEHSTDLSHCLEDHAGEADSHYDGLHVGKQQQQGFVLGCVAQESIRLGSKIFEILWVAQAKLILTPPPSLMSRFEVFVDLAGLMKRSPFMDSNIKR